MENKEENKNLVYYNKLRVVPQTALKTIQAGRLRGMSDINPMWRIKAMTEVFGICGVGWKYEVTKQWEETHGSEVKCFTNINLYVKVDGEWSEPIFGTGGSSVVTMESKGVYVNDEGFKMALTDALSVAMKALGVGADVYFSKDADFGTKYEQQADVERKNMTPVFNQQPANRMDLNTVNAIMACNTLDELKALWDKYPQLHKVQQFTAAVTARKDVITKSNKQ